MIEYRLACWVLKTIHRLLELRKHKVNHLRSPTQRRRACGPILTWLSPARIICSVPDTFISVHPRWLLTLSKGLLGILPLADLQQNSSETWLCYLKAATFWEKQRSATATLETALDSNSCFRKLSSVQPSAVLGLAGSRLLGSKEGSESTARQEARPVGTCSDRSSPRRSVME